MQNTVEVGQDEIMYQILKKVKRFWNDILSIRKVHNQEAECLKGYKNELGNDKLLQESRT